MKVGIVIPGFQSSPDDWCIPAFTNLARELTRHAEVHVFALRYPYRRDHYSIGAVRVQSLGGAPFGRRRYPVVSTIKLWQETIRALANEHRRSSFDAMLGIWATESGWLATRIGRRLGVPTFVHMAGGELVWIPQIRYGNWGRGLAGWMVRQTLNHADRLLVPSGPIKRLLERRATHATSKMVAWPLGVDTSHFSPATDKAALSEGPFTFVAVGSLVPVKGYDLMLRSLARLLTALDDDSENKPRLFIVGSGPLKGNLEHQIQALGLQGYVSLMGEVAHEQLPALFHTAHCFLHTAWHEAQCLAGLEAMSCELPWIAPPVGAFADVDPRGVNLSSGLCIQGRDPEAFADAMLKMVRMRPEERMKLGTLARSRTVLRRYDLSRQTALLADLFATGIKD